MLTFEAVIINPEDLPDNWTYNDWSAHTETIHHLKRRFPKDTGTSLVDQLYNKEVFLDGKLVPFVDVWAICPDRILLQDWELDWRTVTFSDLQYIHYRVVKGDVSIRKIRSQ